MRVCAANGCPEVVKRGYCPAHRPKGTRSPSSIVTGTHRWRVVKAGVLKRDRYRCQLQLPGCTGRATTVDHVDPVFNGGPHYEERNLAASCQSCNARKGGRVHATTP